jgi:hypothetical protein
LQVTQGHTLLERSVTDLEHALATSESGFKNRLARTEKRLASQEAVMKERVASLEVSAQPAWRLRSACACWTSCSQRTHALFSVHNTHNATARYLKKVIATGTSYHFLRSS